MVYLITYDLNKLGKNYVGVENVIKYISNGECLKVLETVWLMKSWISLTKDVLRLIMPAIDNNDGLFVCPIKGDCAWQLGSPESTDITRFFTE